MGREHRIWNCDAKLKSGGVIRFASSSTNCYSFERIDSPRGQGYRSTTSCCTVKFRKPIMEPSYCRQRWWGWRIHRRRWWWKRRRQRCLQQQQQWWRSQWMGTCFGGRTGPVSRFTEGFSEVGCQLVCSKCYLRRHEPKTSRIPFRKLARSWSFRSPGVVRSCPTTGTAVSYQCAGERRRIWWWRWYRLTKRPSVRWKPCWRTSTDNFNHKSTISSSSFQLINSKLFY